MAQWILIEVFDPSREPTIIGFGDSPRNSVPLRTVLRSDTSRRVIEATLDRVRSSGEPIDLVQAGHRVVAHPLRTFAGNLHGVHVWVNSAETDVPPRPPAGAWQFNLTTNKIRGSHELLDLYGVPAERRKTERNMAEAFGRLVTNLDEATALAKIVKAAPGTEHRATWTVNRDDGERRAAHFTCRMVAEQTDGNDEVVLRGITHDIGPADSGVSAPQPVILEHRLLAVLAEPETSRAIVNLRSLRIIRWVFGDTPPDWLAWEYDPDDSADEWIHPDDRRMAADLVDRLARGRAETSLRLRTTSRGWRPTRIVANLVLLDAATTAALFTLHAQVDKT